MKPPARRAMYYKYYNIEQRNDVESIQLCIYIYIKVKAAIAHIHP